MQILRCMIICEVEYALVSVKTNTSFTELILTKECLLMLLHN